MAEIKGAGQLPPAAYTNGMMVTHTQEEFTLTFGQVTPMGQQRAGEQAALLLQALITSPGHAKRMLGALKENIERYERKYGEIAALHSVQPAGRA